ncbi:hypothetical protein J6590_079625 [Homalodisca vitripennis]|nr:hypothetical protein J6590_079625 [Homalodisca vitripennis]
MTTKLTLSEVRGQNTQQARLVINVTRVVDKPPRRVTALPLRHHTSLLLSSLDLSVTLSCHSASLASPYVSSVVWLGPLRYTLVSQRFPCVTIRLFCCLAWTSPLHSRVTALPLRHHTSLLLSGLDLSVTLWIHLSG